MYADHSLYAVVKLSPVAIVTKVTDGLVARAGV